MGRRSRLRLSDRILAWLVTGPVGRFVGFVWEVVVALGRAAAGRPQRED